MGDPVKPLVICEPDEAWPSQFAKAAARLREVLPAVEVVRIDHIGSTSVPDLPAKDVIDVQVTGPELAVADGWPDELLPDLVRRPSVLDDHVPPLADDDPVQWAKRYCAKSQTLHVHVRAEGRANQRYALCSAITSAPIAMLPGPTAGSNGRSLLARRTTETRTTP